MTNIKWVQLLQPYDHLEYGAVEEAFIEGFAHKSYAIEHRLTPESVLVSVSSTEKAFLHLRELWVFD